MKIKIFKEAIHIMSNDSKIETSVNSFIRGKKVIDIKQTINSTDDANRCFIVITVMYEG